MVEDEKTEDLLFRSLHYLKAGYPFHFTGPSGAGKSSLALELAKRRKKPVMLIHGNHELNNKDLIGDFTGYTSKKVVDNYIRSVYRRDEKVTETRRDGRLLGGGKKRKNPGYEEILHSLPPTKKNF